MTRSFRILAASAMLLVSAAASFADLDGLAADLNLQAKADLPGFKAKLGAQFSVTLPEVEAVLAGVPSPADAFLCLQLGRMSLKPMDAVLAACKKNKGKGWGVVAQELGIQPGSDEFKAFKDGQYTLTGATAAKAKEKGNGGGKNKGQGKDKGKGK